ncbi:MAG: hypothetical protein GF331_10350 [Chitinivibrionales bacterium]|nr:hypothetical protein [Chitinivibrionales bacterium]
MNEKEVLEILGEPNEKEPERWIYRTSAGLQAPKPGHHVIVGAVILLESGKVTKVNLAWIDALGSGPPAAR